MKQPLHSIFYMKSYIHTLLIGLITLLTLCSCDDIIIRDDDNEKMPEHNSLEIVKTQFSKDYKTFSVKFKVPENISFYSLTDSSKIHIKTHERNIIDSDEADDMQPILAHVKNIRQEELAANDLSLLIIADLTLSEEEIATEKQAIQQIRKWFAPNNLHIAFMRDRGITETLPLTDYVMDNYFKKSNSQKLLYRSILEKMDEIAQWQNLKKEQKGLIVFSDGDVYYKDVPIDAKHYELQSKLLHLSSDAGYSSVEYINVGTDYEEGEDNEAKSIMQQLTKHTHGLYFEKFNWSKLLADMLATYRIDYADYQLDFINPDNKEYIGKKTHLKIYIYNGRKLLATGCAEYKIGNVYAPVIINGLTAIQVILQGILIAILIWAIAFFALQIAYPYIDYRLFLRKYVTRYTNQSMMFNGIQVSQSCYFCKAPFEEGDEIVVKCKHVLHKSCWDENEYKCPEFGRRCKEGSHYYNANNLMDYRNAPYYTSWIMLSIIAGLIGWMFFIFVSQHFSNSILNNIMLSIHDLQPGSPEAQIAYDNYAKHLNIMPRFGLSINLWLALCLGFMSDQGLPLKMRLKWSTLKAVVAGVAGYLIFLLTCIISIILNLEEASIWIDWMPWVANGFAIAYIATYHTRIVLKKKFIIVSSVVGIVIMYAWANLYLHSRMDNREQLLLCFIFYSIAMAASIAVTAPRSERYFLHIEGAIKPMDIALYKWMRTSPSYQVTIGKSVDCNLQMSWDFGSKIAPKQGLISRIHGHLYLTAIEEGIIVDNKPLPINAKIALYHGKQFTIGKTLFTYIEKDTIS